jgi:uncharacterized membrane protein
VSPLATLDRLPSRPEVAPELTEPSYRPRHRPSRKRSSRPPQCRGVRIPNAGIDHSGCEGHVHRSSRSGFRVVRTRFADRTVLLSFVALAALLVAAPGMPGPLGAVAGLWLLLGAPVALWYPITAAMVTTRDGRVLVSVGLSVLTEIVMALAVNTALPPIGLPHPLARFPLTVGALLVVAVLAAVAPVTRPSARRRPRITPDLRTVLLCGAAASTLAVAGAIRLNNGLGGAVSVVALLAVAGLLALLYVRRERYSSTVVSVGLFLGAGALLLLNSLRGWYITGHDIQLEYQVFQLASGLNRWDIGAFRDPYNACLSINLLPVLVARLTGIPGAYVFKVVLPLFFALTPVLVYRSVRNVAPQFIALLSAIYFMAFPTFFSDMTFMARQEIAFLLLGCVMVVLTDGGRSLRTRRLLVSVLLLGIVLSHYSTTYVVLATFGVALGVDYGRRLWNRIRRRPAPVQGFVTWWMLVLVAAVAVVWTGPVTGTGGQARSTATATVRQLVGGSSQTGSSDTGYSLFGGVQVSPEQRLRDYVTATEEQTSADRAAGAYLPLTAIDGNPVSLADQPLPPLTAIGSAISRLGVDVPALNGLARRAAAGLLQLLLLLGLVVATFVRRRTFRATADQIRLSLGALSVMGVLTILPELSVDYGVLRAFQQGLLFFGPFIAAASVWIFGWTRNRLPVRLAFGLVLVLFLDLTGVVPKLLGGYPAQLQLANTGQYYDIYYVHPEERASIEWLRRHTTPDEFRAAQSGLTTDIFPTLVRTGSYTVLGYTTVHKGEATAVYRGDLVTYRYPVGVLDTTKNKVYSSDGAEIYR